MAPRSQQTWLLAAVTLLATLAPSLGGEWCENFETGAGRFWSERSFSGQWQYTTYSKESNSASGKIPKPTTGEDGFLLLRPPVEGEFASSRLVSPELVFSGHPTIELTYWLWYNGGHSEVNFLLFRLVDGVEDKEPFLNITSYTSQQDKNWSTLEVGLNLDKGKKIRVAIYGYLAGNSQASIALDRVILRGVNDDNACGTINPVLPTEDPGPEGPAFDFFCPTEEGLYMDPEDCAFFYSCSNWRAVHMGCYTDLVFNPEANVCDYLRNVPSCQ